MKKRRIVTEEMLDNTIENGICNECYNDLNNGYTEEKEEE